MRPALAWRAARRAQCAQCPQCGLTWFNCAGSTHSRDRLLAAQGWQVVCVPFFEWGALRKRKAQLAYLRGRLPPHVLA